MASMATGLLESFPWWGMLSCVFVVRFVFFSCRYNCTFCNDDRIIYKGVQLLLDDGQMFNPSTTSNRQNINKQGNLDATLKPGECIKFSFASTGPVTFYFDDYNLCSSRPYFVGVMSYDDTIGNLSCKLPSRTLAGRQAHDPPDHLCGYGNVVWWVTQLLSRTCTLSSGAMRMCTRRKRDSLNSEKEKQKSVGGKGPVEARVGAQCPLAERRHEPSDATAVPIPVL